MMYLKFDYFNWRGDNHTYVIEPTGAGFGVSNYDRGRPVLHGEVITRDGDPRPDMEPTRRRTFVLAKMRAMEEVDAA